MAGFTHKQKSQKLLADDRLVVQETPRGGFI